VKLLLIVGDFPPFVSGIGDYTDLLARSLSASGVDVTVLTLSGDDDGVVRPYRVRREIPAFTMKQMDRLTRIAADYDVVNIQYPGVHYGRSPTMNLFAACLRRRAPRVKTTVTIHDCRVMRWRWRLRTWPMLNSVAGIIHVDPGDWPYIRSWCTFGVPPHACIPIASNVDVVPCTPERRAEWRASLGIGAHETAAAYFGILYPHKGVDELLSAQPRSTQREKGKGREAEERRKVRIDGRRFGQAVHTGECDHHRGKRVGARAVEPREPGIAVKRGQDEEQVARHAHDAQL
jgi:glycosyltransferase involved in cell wall biosynthesis